MAFLAIDELIALGHGRSFASQAAAFSGTHSPHAAPCSPLSASRSRLTRRPLAVLIGGMIFSVSGDPVTHRLGHKIVRGGYRGYRAVLLNDLTHDLGLELLRVFRCWHGIYPIDSWEEKLPCPRSTTHSNLEARGLSLRSGGPRWHLGRGGRRGWAGRARGRLFGSVVVSGC